MQVSKEVLEIAKKYGETAEVRRQNEPGREEPSYHQKQTERQPDGSAWSGASAGGGVWAGRIMH